MIRMNWNRDTDDYGFFRFSLQFTGTTDSLMLQSGMMNVSAAIHPASGTARIEFTLSSPAEVQAGTARWVAWPMGDVARAAADAMISCATALRGVASATAVMEVCAK